MAFCGLFGFCYIYLYKISGDIVSEAFNRTKYFDKSTIEWNSMKTLTMLAFVIVFITINVFSILKKQQTCAEKTPKINKNKFQNEKNFNYTQFPMVKQKNNI